MKNKFRLFKQKKYMHFSPRSGKDIFMHFFNAFRAKREKMFNHFLKNLCSFCQTFKKTLGWACPSSPDSTVEIAQSYVPL